MRLFRKTILAESLPKSNTLRKPLSSEIVNKFIFRRIIMGSKLPDLSHFLKRKENLSTLIMQVNPTERLAFESAVYPILKHITWCESHELYFLDNKHLEVNPDFAIYLFAEEMEALWRFFAKISDSPVPGRNEVVQ